MSSAPKVLGVDFASAPKARCIMSGRDRFGDRIWDRFNAGKDGTTWYYQSRAEQFGKAWPENPLLQDFWAIVQRTVIAGS